MDETEDEHLDFEVLFEDAGGTELLQLFLLAHGVIETMPEPLMKERRKSPRKYLDRPLPIEDRNCGVEIGRVVDVSMDGLMVESHRQWAV